MMLSQLRMIRRHRGIKVKLEINIGEKMSRPKRPGWKPMNMTLSPEVCEYIRRKAPMVGMECGTLADRIIRAQIGMTSYEDASEALDSLPMETSLCERYAACLGDSKKIAELLYHYAILCIGPSIFSPIHNIEVTTLRNHTSITPKMFISMIEKAVLNSGQTFGVEFNGRAIKVFDVIFQSVDLLFERFKRQYPLDAERKEIWTRTSVGAFGILLGESLKPYIDKGNYANAAELVSGAVFTMVKKSFDRRNARRFNAFKEPCVVLVDQIKADSVPYRNRDQINNDTVELDPRLFYSVNSSATNQ